MAETRSAVPSQSTGTSAGVGTGLPSNATTPKDVAGQSEAADFARAGVQHMEQDALALLDPDRVAMPQHLAVDAEEFVTNLWRSRKPVP